MTTNMTPPPEVPGDDRDWTFVIDQGCTECGFQPFPPNQMGDRLRSAAERWRPVLERAGATQRPEEQTWSPVEYACHVRDMITVLQQRVEAMLSQRNPDLEDLEGDAEAVRRGYWRADSQTVLAELTQNAQLTADLMDTVEGQQWELPGRRSDGFEFTIATLCLYIGHEMEHHLYDVNG
ncbi:MAG: DinB family protein [Yaniella sp.]|uniref:DinB family protein n=1 Tax=Yaniella sp. TaxID=2773929 RepID=UPI0026486D4F|nr:DinB family protein [Yaniella sp.]MDN6357917.1 DinB family protein [Yaniella sp.]